MPTYSYRCRDCDAAFDVQQSFDEDSLTVCPQCEGSLRKLFNTVGVVFKGSGFYKTDSRSASKPAATEKKAEPAKTEPAKAESKPESKPVPKAEAKSA